MVIAKSPHRHFNQRGLRVFAQDNRCISRVTAISTRLYIIPLRSSRSSLNDIIHIPRDVARLERLGSLEASYESRRHASTSKRRCSAQASRGCADNVRGHAGSGSGYADTQVQIVLGSYLFNKTAPLHRIVHN